MGKAPTLLPVRGEIWSVNFDPSLGSEIQKLRPALVISIDSIGRLPLRIVVLSPYVLEHLDNPHGLGFKIFARF